MRRVYNFSAGPAMLPIPVLLQAQAEMLDWQGRGVSVMEISHRAAEYIEIAHEARELMRELLNVPANYHVLFLPGGARTQFSAIPMNLLRGKCKAAYIHSGYWSNLALEEGRRYCEVSIAATSQADNFTSFPAPATWQIDESHAFIHYTDNETISGVECHIPPNFPDIPLVSDMSSNILSRAIDVSRYGLIYACAQKNIGPAGITVVIVRDDLVGDALPQTPTMLDYQNQINADSMLNTPPTYPWYLTGLVLKWVKEQGGVTIMEERSRSRSKKLYDFIDKSSFYQNYIRVEHRSRMNVSFYSPSEILNKLFIQASTAEGLVYLKGHAIAGGMRASLYNPMPEAGVDALIDFMHYFERVHG